MFERLKRAISLSGSNEAEPPQVAVEQVQNAEDENDDFTVITSLSWDLRVQCFVGSFFLSLLCSVLGSALLFTRRVTGFCVMVSLGSIISLLGTCFLMGPMKQLQKMFERGRFIATFIYLATIVLTLVAGLVLSNPPLAVLFVINQYIAMAWYSISYIPFASGPPALHRMNALQKPASAGGRAVVV
uniref:Vesicle transport protein n=1 Tax=Ascaris lumbricoides TaxID=6252 RepID=A0A9J2PBQ5_ASCLU